MFNSDLTANRPAAGIVGRIFIATDSPYGIFRDTGTGWDQISSAGGGATLYSGDGTLSGNRTVSSGGFNLTFAPQTTFSSSLTAATGGSSYSVLGSNTLSYAVGFSSSNIGNVYSANGAINLQNFLGNATFAQANLASAMVSVNSIDFGSGGHTITMTQSTGIRAMTGHQSQIQFQGSHNGTISHAAISQNLGFYRAVGSTRTLTITNAYSLLLNDLNDYGAGFTFTNRWGIYQAGASDTNYFAARVGIGTNAPSTTLDVRGSLEIARFGTTGSDNYINVKNTTGDFYLGADSTRAYIWTTTATPIDFLTANVVRMKLFNTGNLLLQSGGTFTDAGFRLDVNGTARISGSLTMGLGQTIFWGSQFVLSRPGSIGVSLSTGGSQLSIVNSANTNSLLIILNTGEATFSSSLQVGGGTINASAILQADSTTKGFLPPRMTNAQRTGIGTPAVGLIVYCTDAVEGLYIYKSTGWTLVI
jgi:hypothetical protein